jgi:hypothetical protein
MQHTCLALVHFRGKRRNDLLDFTEIWNLGRHIESIEGVLVLRTCCKTGYFLANSDVNSEVQRHNVQEPEPAKQFNKKVWLFTK